MRSAAYLIAAHLLEAASFVGGKTRGASIIMGHGVYEEAPGHALPRSSVPLKSFRKGLEALKGCCFVTLDELLAMVSQKAPWRARCVALTFDDSLKCHVETVAPELVRMGIPAAFFLSIESIDDQKPYWWLRLEYAVAKARGQRIRLALAHETIEVDSSEPGARGKLSAAIRRQSKPAQCAEAVSSVEHQLGVAPDEIVRDYRFAEMLKWDDARKLVSLGMTVGSHTLSHPNLALLDRAELTKELGESRRRLEKECAINCRHLCYPHGYASEQARAVARECGYETAVTTESGWNNPGADAYALRRFTLPSEPNKLAYVIARG